MDYTILQPVSSMFLITFSRINVWRTWDLYPIHRLIVTGINMAGDDHTASDIFNFILLTISGAVVIYSLWIVLIAFTFYFTKFDNNVTLLQALLDAGRYPVTVYPAMASDHRHFYYSHCRCNNGPTQGVTTGFEVSRRSSCSLELGSLSFLVASQIWKAGLKRYSGASS